MLKSNPTSGLVLRAMIDLVESLKNWVFGSGSSTSVDGSRSIVMRSKRLAGLGVTPRPRSVGSRVIWLGEFTVRASAS